MKTQLWVVILLAAGTAFAQLNVGIRIGRPPAPRIVRVQPRSPGPGYAWVGGYWYPVSGHYRWHQGYWSRPAYEGAHWVEPRHDGKLYHSGYWDGDHGRVEHNHGFDKDRDRRDFDRHHEQ